MKRERGEREAHHGKLRVNNEGKNTRKNVWITD